MLWSCKRLCTVLDKQHSGQKQADLVWYAHVSDQLQKTGFQPLKSDECVIVQGKCVVVLSDKTFTDKAIKDLISAGLKIEDQGYPSDYVVVIIKDNDDGFI